MFPIIPLRGSQTLAFLDEFDLQTFSDSVGKLWLLTEKREDPSESYIGV